MSKTRYTGVTKDDKTGKYTYYFKAGIDLATGKPYQERRRGFQTAKEAFEARTRALNKVQQQGSIKHTQWTFKQFMEEVFIPNYYATTSPDLEHRRQVIFDEFIQYFGKKKPRDITTYDVINYRNSLLDRYSNSYARNKMTLLNQVLKTAKKYGLIFHEIPTKNISPIPIVKKHIDFWTKDEFQKVIQCLDKESYFEHFVYTLFWLYYFTGMRVAVANFKSACGIFQADKYIGIVQAVVNLVLSIILAKWIGLPGVYLGTVAQGVVDLVWRPRIVYHQIFEESAREYYVQWLKYLALILCMAGICYVAAGFIFVKITLVRVVIAGVVVMLLVNGAFLLLFRKTEEFRFLWGKMQTLFGKYSAKILGRR